MNIRASVKKLLEIIPIIIKAIRPKLTTDNGMEIGLSWKNIREQAHRKKNKISYLLHGDYNICILAIFYKKRLTVLKNK